MWRFSVGGALKSMFWGGVSGAITFGIGEMFKAGGTIAKAVGDAKFLVQGAAHGVAQGALSMMQGGKFWSGATAGFLGHLGGAAWSNTVGNSNIGAIGFGALSGGVGAELTGGNFWQGAVTGGIVAGLNGVMHKVGDPKPKPKPKVVDDTSQALDHYYEDGTAVELGSNTKRALLQDEDYKRVLGALKSGTANSRTNHFDVHFTSKIFHIGDSNVNYSTSCTTGNCTTTFSAFVNDGFSDPLDLGFELSFNASDVNFIAKPYNYIPYNFSVTYPNPGYPVGTNIK